MSRRAAGSAVEVFPHLKRPVRRIKATVGLRSFGPALEARIINPLCERDWDNWITSHPEATVFHSSAWARVLSEAYGHRPCYLRILTHGEPLALVPLMEVGTLFTRRRGI